MIDPFDLEDDEPEPLVDGDGEPLLSDQEMWKLGMRRCNWHDGWVPAAEAHRQVGSPNTVHCCRECIEGLDLKERRPVPDARIELKPVKTPQKLGALWKFLEEEASDE